MMMNDDRALLIVLLLSTTLVSPQRTLERLNLWNDARIVQGSLWITADATRSIGRAMFSQPIDICRNATNNSSSFATTFVFSITNYSTSARGEGLAFFVAGAMAALPADSYGQWLGLFDARSNRSPGNRLVAVEFDSAKAADDLDANHVGVDVNQIQSQVTPSLGSDAANRVDLHDSAANVSVWIDYDGAAKAITVFVNRNQAPKPPEPIVAGQPVDLCAVAASEDGSFFVGFSASTGDSSRDVHKILSWNFSTSSPESSFRFDGFDDGTSDQLRRSRTRPIAAIVSASIAALVVVLLLLLWCTRRVWLALLGRESRATAASVLLHEHDMAGIAPAEFSFAELKSATSSFADKNVLGRGGFGTVYVGLLSSDSCPVAVKRISEHSQQGAREFLAEVQIISKLSHRNLVHLRGWCCRSKELLLVYDFMPNGSLDQALYHSNNSLEWSKRYEIVAGLASALLYLHEECEERVIHRDVKPSNVLLDAEFNARLGDFGLARLVDRRRDARTTVIAGTFGYLAPELNLTGQCTTASDVYSFGILALEVGCGKKPFSDDHTILSEWTWQLYRTRRLIEAADPRLMENFDRVEMELLLTVGLACSDPRPRARPTMRQVVSVLNRDVPPFAVTRDERLEVGSLPFPADYTFSLLIPRKNPN